MKNQEDRARNNLRQDQLRKAGKNAGTSSGFVDLRAMGFETPSEAEFSDPEEIERFNASLENFRRDLREREQNAITTINASILGDTERYRERVRNQQFEISEMAKNDAGEAHRQQLPTGVPIRSMATDDEEEMPPLETPTEVAEEEEEEEEEEDSDETQAPPRSRKHKETIVYNSNIDRWNRGDVSVDDLLFQLHMRGTQLTEEQQEEMSKLKRKGEGKTPTQKDYLLTYVRRLMVTGKWADEVNDQLLQSRKEEWIQMKKGKGKGVLRKAFEIAGSSLLEAGKEVAKDAL